jgi:hypothetical protein
MLYSVLLSIQDRHSVLVVVDVAQLRGKFVCPAFCTLVAELQDCCCVVLAVVCGV